MFESLSNSMVTQLKKLRGQARLTEENVQEALKQIRRSLLEADVNFKVVKSFIDKVKEKSLGQEVLHHLNPGQQIVKIVHDELIQVLGGEGQELKLKRSPSVIFLVGLQGSGKTTSAGKLALYLRNKLNRRPGMVSVDVYRPAAMEQLAVVGKKNQIPTYAAPTGAKPSEILQGVTRWAGEALVNTVIVDTAGRLQIDEGLMNELSQLKELFPPDEVLLVADAMLGQQAVNVAEGFHQRVGLTGLVLTKIDGDARGGAALSVRHVTGVPIKFLGTGEKPQALEVFHPDRLASRILDMGDVLSLVEKAHEVVSAEEAQASAKKLAKNEFTLEDFLAQLQQLKKLGGMESLMKYLPGMGQMSQQLKNMVPPDKETKKIEAIIRSMTPLERKQHKILNGSRRLRIAKGSGTEVKDVNRLVNQFEESKKMMGSFMKGGMGKGRMPFMKR